MNEPLRPSGATGLGSWPGESPIEAARAILGNLAEGGIPYLPELPARGPGADMIGRSAALLTELPVDLQPSGWRFVDRPGRYQRRADAFLTADLDALAEAAEEYHGPLKVQVCGAWTLMSGIRLQRGERTVADPGARHDVVASLAEGVRKHVETVQRQIPGAQLILQLDEPSLPAVLAGRLPTQSGVGRIRAVEGHEVTAGLESILVAAKSAGAVATVIHCCAANVPVRTLARTDADALALDLNLLGQAGWESVAEAVESGTRLWCGAVPTVQPPDGPPTVAQTVETIRTPWRRVGLPFAGLDDVVVTPTCGLARASASWARAAAAHCGQVARALAEESAG